MDERARAAALTPSSSRVAALSRRYHAAAVPSDAEVSRSAAQTYYEDFALAVGRRERLVVPHRATPKAES
jgi:hypothetical protein